MPYYVEPLVVGLEQQQQQQQPSQPPKNESDNDSSPDNSSDKPHQYRPFLCSLDMIGARSQADSFVCAGVATQSLYGTAEALWRPNLSPEELVRLCGQAFMTALERDCLSGYGALVYLITRDGIVEYDLDTRNDWR